jgi:tetrapyrrole methylase family protein/MazG family protein
MEQLPGITLLGLGPGDPSLLTRKAWEVLERATEIYLRTRQHPTIQGFPARIHIHSFDHLYEESDTFSEVYVQIVNKVVELGKRPQGVIYAEPGHPFIAEATSTQICARQKLSIPVHVIDGLSLSSQRSAPW